MSNRFEGRVAVITGASRGIGLATATQIVREGGSVCLTARDPGNLEAAAMGLGAPDRVLAVAGKADDPAHRTEVMERVTDRFGRLDVLINNTGISPAAGPLLSYDIGAVRKIFEVNVIAALCWAQEAVRRWFGDGGGAVVNVASVAGMRPSDDIGAYAVSKAALLHLTRQLAWELGPKTRVNCVAPAVVRTRLAGAMYADEEAVARHYPLGRIGEPDDVADAICYLASDDARWVTGHALVIDGGLLLNGGV